MAEITNEDLLNEGRLQEKLEANQESLKEIRQQHDEVTLKNLNP